MFSAPADSFESFSAVIDSIYPPSLRESPTNPPYDTLFADGMAEAGFENSSVLLPNGIDGTPNGVNFFYSLLPDSGTIGASFDFESGPIIPKELFPLTSDTDLLKEGTTVDGDFPRSLSPDGSLFNGVDGVSRFTVFNGTAAFFFPSNTELVGDYTWRAVLRDQEGNGWDIEVPFEVVPPEPCDFNGDGSCDADDLARRTLFRTNLTEGSERASIVKTYDMTGDGVVDTADLQYWLEDAAKRNGLASMYLAGDANLDGNVGFDDFLALSENFDSSSRDWAHGNFNGDRVIDFADFLALSANYGKGVSGIAAAVPEPTGGCLAIVATLGLIGIRRRR